MNVSQIEAARREGYSDAEIVEHLAGSMPSVRDAEREGYSATEILDHLTSTTARSTSQGDIRAFEQAKAREDDRELGDEAAVAAVRGLSQTATDVGKAALNLTPLGTAARVIDWASGGRAGREVERHLGTDSLAAGDELIAPTRDDRAGWWANLGGEVLGGAAVGGAGPRAAVQGAKAAVAEAAKQTPLLIPVSSKLASAAHLPFIGKTITEQGISPANQRGVVHLIKRSLGMADDVPLTLESVKDVRRAAGATYERVKDIGGRVAFDQNYQTTIQRAAAERMAGLEGPRAAQSRELLADEVADYLKLPDMSPRGIVEEAKRLRADVNALYIKGGADDLALAEVKKAISGALESQLERALRATRPELADELGKARKTIARSYDVGGRKGKGGVLIPGAADQVDPTRLAALARKDEIGDELRKAAEFAAGNKGVLKPNTAIQAGNALMDPIIGIGAAAATGDPRAMLLALSRPAARASLKAIAARAATKGNRAAQAEALRLLAIAQSGRIDERKARLVTSALAVLNEFADSDGN